MGGISLSTGLSPLMEANAVRSTRYYCLLPNSPVARSDAAEEDLHPVGVVDMRVMRRMFQNRSILGRYFEGVELDKTHSRGRLLPTQELQSMYPEDDQVGSSWVCRGALGNRKPSFDTPSSR